MAPPWQRIETAVAADVAWRSGALAAEGVRALPDTFRPTSLAGPPGRSTVLSTETCSSRAAVRCWCPRTGRQHRRPDASVAPAQLARSLGPTRAALLYETAMRGFACAAAPPDPVVVSVPSASRQLAVLREAGLVTSRRDGKCVLHSVTALALRPLGNLAGAAVEERF